MNIFLNHIELVDFYCSTELLLRSSYRGHQSGTSSTRLGLYWKMLQLVSGFIGRVLLARRCHQTVGFCTWFSSELALIVFAKCVHLIQYFQSLFLNYLLKSQLQLTIKSPFIIIQQFSLIIILVFSIPTVQLS